MKFIAQDKLGRNDWFVRNRSEEWMADTIDKFYR